MSELQIEGETFIDISEAYPNFTKETYYICKNGDLWMQKHKKMKKRSNTSKQQIYNFPNNKNIVVSRLVYYCWSKHFSVNTDVFNYVIHIDGDQMNNNYSNLEGRVTNNAEKVKRKKQTPGTGISKKPSHWNKSQFRSIGKTKRRDCSHYYVNSKGDIFRETKNASIMIKSHLQSNGYQSVNIGNGSEMLHRIVAKTWLPDGDRYFFDTKWQVNHIDENKSNNSVDNLEWVTSHDNQAYSRGRGVKKLDPSTGLVIDIYKSAREAHRQNCSKEETINGSGIVAACKRQKQWKGFRWEYTD